MEINTLFSNKQNNGRFLPRMYIYIGFNIIVDFCHGYGANKRIFAACKNLQFCKG